MLYTFFNIKNLRMKEDEKITRTTTRYLLTRKKESTCNLNISVEAALRPKVDWMLVYGKRVFQKFVRNSHLNHTWILLMKGVS